MHVSFRSNAKVHGIRIRHDDRIEFILRLEKLGKIMCADPMRYAKPENTKTMLCVVFEKIRDRVIIVTVLSAHMLVANVKAAMATA